MTVVLADDVDVSRGDIISSVEQPAPRADAFAAHLVWMSEMPLLPGRGYLLKAGAQTIGAMVTELKHRIDIETFDHLAAKELHLNEIAFVNIATAEANRLRSLRRQSRYRRIHSDRPAYQWDGRRRD